MANKMGIEFDGFDEVLARISKLNGDTKNITEDALKQTKRHIHKNLGAAMQKHNRTYETVKSLDNESNVEWVGNVASINVGFHLGNGGLPSIFLMYGTPRMPKDQNLYNAIYGSKTKKEIMQIQEEIFFNELRRLNG